MTTKNKDFLEWLVKRLANKYHEDDIIVKQLNSIRNDFFIVPKKISISLINSLCRKHFPDFDMDKCPEFSGGFDEDERRRIRNLIIDTLAFAENSE